MAGEIDFEIHGDRKFGLRLESMTARIRAKLKIAIEKDVQSLLGAVVAREPHKTGKLAAGTITQVFDDPDHIKGRVVIVGKQAAKAGAFEYGSRGGGFEVKSHSMRLDHVFANKLAAPLNAMVMEHDRFGGLGAMRFLRGAGSALEGQIIADLREAIGEAVTQDAE